MVIVLQANGGLALFVCGIGYWDWLWNSEDYITTFVHSTVGPLCIPGLSAAHLYAKNGYMGSVQVELKHLQSLYLPGAAAGFNELFSLPAGVASAPVQPLGFPQRSSEDAQSLGGRTLCCPMGARARPPADSWQATVVTDGTYFQSRCTRLDLKSCFRAASLTPSPVSPEVLRAHPVSLLGERVLVVGVCRTAALPSASLSPGPPDEPRASLRY